MNVELDYVPIRQFSRRISEGWKMVPGYPLQPGDYAVVMMPPNFDAKRLSNISRAHMSSPVTTALRKLKKQGAPIEA